MTFQNHDVPLAIIAILALAIIAYTGVILFMWLLSRRRKAQALLRERQQQSKSDATRNADKAHNKLQARLGRPIVLEVINDMTFDGTGGGAKDMVDIATAIDILAALKSAPETQPVEIVLHTLGGWGIALLIQPSWV